MTAVYDASSALAGTDDGNGNAGATFRVVYPTNFLTPVAGGNQLQVVFLFGASEPTETAAVTEAWFGPISSGTTFDGTQQQLKFGGGNTFSGSAAGIVTSDLLTLTNNFDATKSYAVSWFFNGAASGHIAYVGYGSGTHATGYFDPTGNHAGTSALTSVNSFGLADAFIEKILVTVSGGGGSSTLTAAQGSFALTGEPAAFKVVLTAAQGSFALTGEPAALSPGLVSAQGSYALTGIAATLTATGSSNLTAAQGSFALTGEPAGLDPALVSAQGSFALTGEAAAFKTVLTSAQGSYTLTGEPAALMPGLVSAQGSYALTGEASAFGVTLGAAQGSYALTGIAATLSVTGNQTLTAAQGTYALTGEPVGFLIGFTAAQGGYTLTGEAATGTATANGTLTANTGHYVLTGIAATLTASGFVAPIPVMKPYQPRAYPQITPGIPMWHTGQNNDISASVASLIETIKVLDARLRTGGL